MVGEIHLDALQNGSLKTLDITLFNQINIKCCKLCGVIPDKNNEFKRRVDRFQSIPITSHNQTTVV